MEVLLDEERTVIHPGMPPVFALPASRWARAVSSLSNVRPRGNI